MSSSDITFGFLGNPESTTQVTASYTIPAAKFAVVSASVKAGGTITINSVTVLHSGSWTVLSASGLKYVNETVDYNAGTGTINSDRGLLTVNPSATVNTVNSPTVVDAFTGATAETCNQGSYMAKAGDILNGSGTWGAHVALYAA